MNKWKIGFWVCLFLWLLTTLIGVYSVVNQGVTLTYMEEGYADTESDLKTLIQLFNERTFSKPEVVKELKDHNFSDPDSDTLSLNRVIFIFENEQLVSIENQW